MKGKGLVRLGVLFCFFSSVMMSPASGQAGCASGVETISSALTVGGSRTFSCATTILEAAVTVETGGSLNLGTTQLWVSEEAAGDLVLRVKAGGSLLGSPGASVGPESSASPRLSILLEPASAATLVGVRMDRLAGLEVHTDQARLEHVRILDSLAAGVHIVDADPVITGAWVSGSDLGVRVDGAGANPSLTAVRTTEIGLAALQVSSGAHVLAERSRWDAAQVGVVLRAGSILEQSNGSFGQSPVQVEFVPVGKTSPRLHLRNSAFDEDKFLYHGPEVRVDVEDFVRAGVEEDPESPGVQIEGVVVKFRRPDGEVRHTVSTDAWGRTPVVLVNRSRSTSGTVDSETAEWLVTAQQGSSVAAATWGLVTHASPPRPAPPLSYRYWDSDASDGFGAGDTLVLSHTGAGGATQYADMVLSGPSPGRIGDESQMFLPLKALPSGVRPHLCQGTRGDAGASDDAFYLVLGPDAPQQGEATPVGSIRIAPPPGLSFGSAVGASDTDGGTPLAADCLVPAEPGDEADFGTYQLHQLDVGPDPGSVDVGDWAFLDTGPAANVVGAPGAAGSGFTPGDLRLTPTAPGLDAGTLVTPGAADLGLHAGPFDRRFIVELPHDADLEPPQWPPMGPRLRDAGDGFSADGNVQLAWDAASDGPNDRRAVDFYRVTHDDGAATRTNASSSLRLSLDGLASGLHLFRVAPVDLAGLEGAYSPELPVTVDRSAPTIVFRTNITGGPTTNHYNRSFQVNITVSDADTEPGDLTYRVGDAGEFAPYVGNLTIDADGFHNITARSANAAGAVGEVTRRYVLDRLPPRLSVSVTPPIPDGLSGWYKSAPGLSAAAADRGPSGVGDVRFRLGPNGAWTALATSAQIKTPGDHMVEIQAKDGAGNAVTTTRRIAVDSNPPSLSARTEGTLGASGWYVGGARVVLQATDATSGVARREFRLGNGAWSELHTALNLTASGSHRVGVRAVDVAGNPSDGTTLVVNVDGEPPSAPGVNWIALPEGRIRADWTGAPPIDLVSGLARVVIQLADAAGDVRQSFAAVGEETGVTVGPVANGEHKVRVLVADQAGNEARTPFAAVTVRDSPASALEAGVRSVRGIESLSYSPPPGFEPVEVRLLVDEQIVAATTSAPFEFTLDTQQYDDGIHVVRFVALNLAGEEHEVIRSVEVRNSYSSVVQDYAVPIGTVSVASVVAALGSLGAAVGWRRWAP